MFQSDALLHRRKSADLLVTHGDPSNFLTGPNCIGDAVEGVAGHTKNAFYFCCNKYFNE